MWISRYVRSIVLILVAAANHATYTWEWRERFFSLDRMRTYIDDCTNAKFTSESVNMNVFRSFIDPCVTKTN